MLIIENLSVSYGAIRALHGVSLSVPEKSIVTLIGSNGAGKSTTLRTISGLVRAQGGAIHYDGQRIDGLPPHAIVARGLSQVPEGRMVFANLTVQENLSMGAHLQRDAAVVRKERDFVLGVFPRLAEREKQVAGTLSGGEQQMLAIGRALMSGPKLVLFDEPSLGLAPTLVERTFEIIKDIRARGVTVVLVEQNAFAALELSDRSYVLEQGRVALSGTGAELLDNPHVKSAYLGA